MSTETSDRILTETRGHVLRLTIHRPEVRNAVAVSQEIIRHSSEGSDEEVWREPLKYAQPVIHSEDTREGLAAFAEKRKPVWKGR